MIDISVEALGTDLTIVLLANVTIVSLAVWLIVAFIGRMIVRLNGDMTAFGVSMPIAARIIAVVIALIALEDVAPVSYFIVMRAGVVINMLAGTFIDAVPDACVGVSI